MRKRNLKRPIILISYTVLLLFLLLNFNRVWEILSTVFSVLMPFVVGFIVAFLVNLPYVFSRTGCWDGCVTRVK